MYQHDYALPPKQGYVEVEKDGVRFYQPLPETIKQNLLFAEIVETHELDKQQIQLALAELAEIICRGEA